MSGKRQHAWRAALLAATFPRDAMQCSMDRACTHPVTHIGEKGYIYCEAHAVSRRGLERCRKMRHWEIAMVKSGVPLPSYEPKPKPATTAKGDA